MCGMIWSVNILKPQKPHKGVFPSILVGESAKRLECPSTQQLGLSTSSG